MQLTHASPRNTVRRNAHEREPSVFDALCATLTQLPSLLRFVSPRSGFARDVLTAHEIAYTPPPLPSFLQPPSLAPGLSAGPPGSEGTPRLVVQERWQFPTYVDHGGWWGDWATQRNFSVLLWLGFAAAVYHFGHDQLLEWWKGTQIFQVSELIGKKEYPPASVPKTRFSDVVGCDEAKSEVAEVVEFLKNPEKFDRLGGRMTRGLLLLGPPGTGKTLLARAMAGEAGVPFFATTGADFEEKYTGVGAKRVRELFEAAKRHKRAIIFIVNRTAHKRSGDARVQAQAARNSQLTCCAVLFVSALCDPGRD